MTTFHRKQKRLGRINDTPIFVGDTANETIAASTKRKNGGRPLGSSDKRKRENNISVVATTNEITIAFNSEKQAAFDNKKRMKKGRLTELINEIKSKNNIATSIKIQENTIRRRSQRGKMYSDGVGGHQSPLTPIEPTIVSTIIQMARIRQCLTPSQGLKLVNDIIKDTPVQQDLEDFKTKFSLSKNPRSVGSGYWRGFKKRNGHLIVSKRGQKYELDSQHGALTLILTRYTIRLERRWKMMVLQ